MTFDFDSWHATQLKRVELALDRFTPLQTPDDLGFAMRYGVLNGGKRLRALLVLAASDAVDGNPAAALRAACAVEMVHAYSLIHDDLPCMDNDVLRRGKPTAHVAFGEAKALLAGDALQALAFETLTADVVDIDSSRQVKLCRLLARASGVEGMAGGQAIDLASVGVSLTQAQLKRMHELKTGALLKASVDMGAACAKKNVVNDTCASLAPQGLEASFAAFGVAIGLAFQVVDDILDVAAVAATLGKTVGKDAAHNKPTYVTLMGLEAAKCYADDLLAQALAALADCHFVHDGALRELAIRLVRRQS